jgi:predicted dehydrogenase
MSLRSAVVGVGYLGRFHAQKHKALGTLKFVCDVSGARAREVSQELQCEGVTDPRDLLGKVEAVTVAADTRHHYELCRLFLSEGIHVFVEKPICTTVQEAEEIVELAAKKNLQLAVGHVERFNPAFVAGARCVQNPKYLRLQRLAPFKPRSLSVDVVLDLMIHDLDLAAALARSRVRGLRARGAKVITDFNDVCDAWLEFENGLEAFISASRVDQGARRTVEVFDDAGLLQMDLGAQRVTRLTQASGPSPTPLGTFSPVVEKWDAMQRETEDFFQAVEGGRSVLVDGRQGLEALRSAEKILELCR